MLSISVSAYFTPTNNFRVKEVYVSDGQETYILKASDYFKPVPYKGSLEQIQDSMKNCFFPIFSMSKIRYYDDDDAKSLATFFQNTIRSLDFKDKYFDKKLFEVISGFGEEKA